VGEWPKLDNIVKITRIVVYAGAIIDSVRITYQLKVGGPKTVQHGGNGGKLVLDYTLAGNFYCLQVSKIYLLRSPLELQLLRNLLLCMAAGSIVPVVSATKSVCCSPDCRLWFSLKLMGFRYYSA
jgi:hypothetical protein